MFVDFNILNQLGSPSINSNTFANRPSAGQVGRLFVSTDTFEIYRDNGTGWDLIGGPGSSTVTGSGAAGQVTYWTGTNSVGGENNLWWDAANNRFGVNTNTPTAAAEVVQTDGVALYSNFTTNAGSGTGTTALWAINNTNSSGYAAVIEEKTPNTTAGQYPLVVKHSLSSGTAGIGMGTGLHFQLPDDAGTYKTTQLTIETIDAAAATYKTRYRFMVQNNGSSTAVAYLNSTGLGLFTATPGAALDVHSTGTIAQFNTTSGTGNTYIAFQRTGTGIWRIGDTYNGGNNFFELHNTVLGVDAMEFQASTNKSTFQAQETYTTGQARGNYFDYNLSVAAGGSFSSPNAITSLGTSLDLTLAGNATIPSGARSGLDAYNSIAFTGTGTLTQNQGTKIRAYSNLTTGWAFGGSATGTITHLAGLRVLFPDNSGSAIAITNNYGLLINDQTANTGTVTYTNRWGVYQEGTSDLNYMAANLLLGSTTNNGNKLQVTGISNFTGNVGIGIVTASSQLEVSNSSGDTRITVSSTGGTGASDLMLKNSTGTVPYEWLLQSLGADGRFRIFDNAGGSTGERFTILQDGKIGFGTSNPSDNFEVSGTGFVVTNVTATTNNSRAYTQWTAKDSGGNAIQGLFGSFYDANNVDLRAVTNHPLRLMTNNTTRQFITAGGNVLIGTTTDAGQKLQVNGTTSISSDLNVASYTLFVNASTNKTSLGTTSQVGQLDIVNTKAAKSINNTKQKGTSEITLDILTITNTSTNCGLAIYARVLAAAPTGNESAVIEFWASISRVGGGAITYTAITPVVSKQIASTNILAGTLAWSGNTLQYTTSTNGINYVYYTFEINVGGGDTATITFN